MYRNGLVFLNEFSETYTDVVEADTEHEREEAKKRFYSLHHSIKRYETEGGSVKYLSQIKNCQENCAFEN